MLCWMNMRERSGKVAGNRVKELRLTTPANWKGCMVPRPQRRTSPGKIVEVAG